MPFNYNFAAKSEQDLIDQVQEARGCFNIHCKDPAASKGCTLCKVAVYCSKECQASDWNAGDFRHKKVCKVYRDNVGLDASKKGKERTGAVAIGLLSVKLINEDTCTAALKERTEAFLDEAKRCLDIELQNDTFGFRKATIGLAAAVVFNMGRARLQCAVTIHDEEAEVGFGQGVATVNHVIFEAIDDSDDGERSGNISKKARACVIEILKTFIRKVNNRYGISVQSINYGRGLSWVSEDDSRDDKKLLEEANGGSMIIWMPEGMARPMM